MSLKQQLNDELQRLSTGSAGEQLLAVREGEATLRVEAESIESVGCAVRSITLETSLLADATMDRLQEISRQLTERISYLLEPLAEIECDTDRCTLQLRSNPPQREGDRRAYYELLVKRGGCITLTRYEKANGTARQPVAAQLTREVLVRLVGDMEAAVEQ